MFKFISFELFDTLIKFNKEYISQRNILIADLLKNSPDINISKKYLQFNDDELIKLIKNTFENIEKDYSYIQQETGVAIYECIVNKLCKILDCQIHYTSILVIIKSCIKKYPPILMDGVLEVLNNLKDKKIEMVVTYNAIYLSKKEIINILQDLGIFNHFKHIYSNSKLSTSNPKYFLDIYNNSNALLSESIHVGPDLKHDVVNPQVFGFKVYHVNTIYKSNINTFYNTYFN